ncbi:phosphatase PAP2 family protein [Alphaproteobacteria bacterium]|nr:phosphatase PAP2 family protein [Alphaproteobacteria bacterium]
MWFFIIAILGITISYLLSKSRFKNEFIKNLKNFFLFLFSAILVTGVLTQIIKHIVGRPRPNYSLEGSSFGFEFFSFESSFHSFPSGHTSTIFVVALALSMITPKIKIYYIFFALIVSLSRMVVGAHFFSDVMGGIVVAFIGIKLTLFVFKRFKIKSEIFEIKTINSNIFFLSIIVFLISILYVSIGNSIDIYIGGLFYEGNQKFFIESFSLTSIMARKIFLPLLIVYIIICPILSLYIPIKNIFFGFKFILKDIIFIFSSVLFNLIIVVNVLLKGFWGRARPNDILDFGGEDKFSAWFQYSDACNSNCSFVSGDASVGFSLIVLYLITKNRLFFWLSLFSGIILGVVRISEGGHFFSDILMSGLIIYFLSFSQFQIYNKTFKDVY